jgi:signal transduction histidine kinase
MPLIETHQALIRRLEQTRRPLEIYRLQDELGHRRSTDYAAIEIREILAVFHALNVELIVPSFIRRRLDLEGIGKERVPGEEDVEMRNILMLGGKKSDEPYSDDELEVFYSLAQESAIAVENARLYDEAIKRTALLERMNRELADINARLQVTQASLIVAEKNATMVGMAKAIGHEINNPLTSVILPVEKIRRETGRLSQFFKEKVAPLIGEEDRAKIEKALGEIDKSSERANRSAYRINAVVHTLTHILKNSKEGMQPLSLIVLCREAVEATRFSTYEENLTGCEIVLNIASNLIIMGNLDQLLQVFINLIKNAYEAMSNPRDRRIEIAADVDAADRRMAHIEFKDNGPGIPPEILPKIWLQGFSTKEKHGSGLGVPGQGQGLFVCKHMIESLHKGTISVESTMGQGTTFMIRLPLAEDCQIHE